MAAGDLTQGRSRPEGTKPWDLEPGDYAIRIDGPTGTRMTWVVTPNGNGPGRLEGWNLIEHEDGTITVDPSIEAHPTADAPYWHGYLEHGVWREV